MSEIKDKIEVKGLIVSRIPSWAKTYIKERAKSEFSDDYGQTIAYLIKMCEEYEALKAKFFQGDLQLQFISNAQSEATSDSPKSISGQPIKLFGGNNVKNK